MTTNEPEPPTGAMPAGASRTALGLTVVVLLAVAVTHATFVVPTYRALLESLGTELSLPSRLAIGLGRYGSVLIVAYVAALGLGLWRGRRAPRRVVALLAWGALALAVYVGLVSWVYVDAARVFSRIH